MTLDTETASKIVRDYLSCWNEPDTATRRALVESTWSADARSVDPLTAATGRDEIDAMLAATQAQFPGHLFALVGDVSHHHDMVHWAWKMTSPAGPDLLAGFDVARIEDGKIAFLAGFFDQ
jgi:hypothetical protein